MNGDFTRRSLFGAALAGFGASALANTGLAQRGRRERRPKNVIFLVSDGMSAGVPSMLDHYLQMVEGRPSYWRGIMEHPETTHGLEDTRSLSSLVTDSAAASSAWGSGRHVWNGQLNQFPDGTQLTPLYDLLGAAKMRRGLVSTATITHATPAGFAVSNEKRDDEEGIALQYLASGVEVLMGGGDRFFSAGSRKDKRDLYADFRAKGYGVARTREEMLAQKGGKLLGIFSPSHIPYYVDRRNDKALAGIPTLADMTRVAIEKLNGSSEGFILQVEAARVDHAAHGNDLAGILYDQLEFDDAIRVAVEFARQNGETLVVVTSDHGNSNPGLNGAGPEYFNSTGGLKLLSGMKRSYEATLGEFGAALKGHNPTDLAPTLANVKGLTEATMGVKLTDDEAKLLVQALNNQSPLKPIEQYQLASSAFAIVLGNHTHVGWTGRQHTDDYMIVSALGPGRELFGGMVANVDFFSKLLSLRGLKHSNPAMTFEEASRAMERKKAKALAAAVESHWV